MDHAVKKGCVLCHSPPASEHSHWPSSHGYHAETMEISGLKHHGQNHFHSQGAKGFPGYSKIWNRRASAVKFQLLKGYYLKGTSHCFKQCDCSKGELSVAAFLGQEWLTLKICLRTAKFRYKTVKHIPCAQRLFVIYDLLFKKMSLKSWSAFLKYALL